MVPGILRTVLLLAATSAGCASEGLLPSIGRTPSGSMQTPTLSWNPFPTPDYEKLRDRITEVSYELRIWEADRDQRKWVRKVLAYSKIGIAGPVHLVDIPLAPGTHYVWSVRARFKLDGEWRRSPWSADGSWDRSAEMPEFGYAHFSIGPQ